MELRLWHETSLLQITREDEYVALTQVERYAAYSGGEKKMDNLIMTIHVIFDKAEINTLQGPWGGVTFIPFEASVESSLFTGKTLPGAADVQTENRAGVRHLCAKYMFDGKDGSGNPCRLFVQNDGYLTPANRNEPVIGAQPFFLTDSRELGEYLCQNRFRSEVHGTGAQTLDILIFDIQ